MSYGDDFKSEKDVGNSNAENREHEPAMFAKRVTEVPSNMKHKYDYNGETDGLPLYAGHAPKGLADDGETWLLQRFTYDANRQCTQVLVAYDTWDNRSGASYS